MASRTKAAAAKTAPAATAKKGAKVLPKKAAPVRSDEWSTEIAESALNEQVLQTELRGRNLETRGATMVLAKRLERYICGNAGSVKLVRCDDCKGRSLATDKRCPFCGSTDEVVTDDQAKAVPPAPPAPANDDDADAEVEADDANDASDDASDDGDDVPAGPGSESGLVLSTPESEAEAAAALASAGVQPTNDEVADFDRRVARVRELALVFVTAGWDLGNELNELHDTKIWLARRMGSGAPKYRSFAAFIEGEFGNDPSWARQFMAVARTFTREQVLAHGVSKMVLLVRIPEHVREQILRDGDAMGLPVRGIREVTRQITAGVSVPTAVANVQAERVGAPVPEVEEPDANSDEPEEQDDASDVARDVGSSGASTTPSIRPVAPVAVPKPKKEVDPLGAVPKPEREVTVVTMPGHFQVKMYAYNGKRPLAKQRRAFNIAEKPRGTYRFPNGAELRIGIHQMGTGPIYLTCEMSPPTGEG